MGKEAIYETFDNESIASNEVAYPSLRLGGATPELQLGQCSN